MFGPDLPLPVAGRLTVYLLGPGVGESAVVVLPDGSAIVVDSCVHDDKTLPGELLRHLGISKITLLVISHPDLDHIRGIAELLRDFEPTDVWCYPMGNSLRDCFVDYCRASGKVAYAALADALRALDDYQERTGCVAETNYGARRLARADVVIHSLAPTHYDQSRTRKVWNRVLRIKGGPGRFFEWILVNKGKLGDAPNALSLALVVAWKRHRILLGGDVMKGSKSPFSGWKGVLRLLQKEQQEALITDMTVVKVAHHGSKHSFEPRVWDLHAKSARPIAAAAPFASSGLPDSTTLGALTKHTDSLLVSAGSPALAQRTTGTGWGPSTVHLLTKTRAPCIVVELGPDGVHAQSVSATASAFAPTAR